MDVEVFLTSGGVQPEDVRGRLVVVIDVLRTSTTMVAALRNGARSIVPVADMADAGKMAANLDPARYVLGGERNGIKIDGYHLGNSPFEYTPERVLDRTVIMNTTNGTGSIVRCAEAEVLLIGGLVNASAVADVARRSGLDVTLVCAGWKNRISLEDTLCAGLILDRITQDDAPGIVSDGAHIALTQYRNERDALEVPLMRCNHSKRLIEMGREADIVFCIGVDTLPEVPIYRDSQIVLESTVPA